MNFFNRLRETLTHLDNALDNAAHPQAGRPVFAIIDTETTGFNKRYDRIIELAAARFDESFRLVDQWHTLINPDGKQIKSDFGQVGRDAIEKWVIDPTYAHSGITPEEIKNKQGGLLTQLENTVRSAPDRVDQTRADIKDYQQTIDDIDQLGDPESFPQQDQLDSARKELGAVTQRLADFNASDAEVRRREEYASRLASKGRSPGYSLELNPTRFMRDMGIVCHPDSKPISRTTGDTALMDPPDDDYELHPEAQASMDFLNGLGLGEGTNNSLHSDDEEDDQEEDPSQPLDEEQEDDNGNEL